MGLSEVGATHLPSSASIPLATARCRCSSTCPHVFEVRTMDECPRSCVTSSGVAALREREGRRRMTEVMDAALGEADTHPAETSARPPRFDGVPRRSGARIVGAPKEVTQ